jgi:regulatory protein
MSVRAKRRGSRPLPPGGIITALRFQEHHKDRVNLFLDDAFALALPALEAARLKVGQALSAEEVQRLAQAGQQQLAYEKALRFLAYRPRSVDEMQRFLREKDVAGAEAEAIIGRLQAAGYLDDQAFARWWVENRAQFSPRGSYALRRELQLKGVPDDIIAGALTEFCPDEEASIENAARRRASRLRNEDRPAFKRKLSAFLLRRGYAYEDIAAVVERLWQEVAGRRQEETETDDMAASDE